MGDDAAPSHVIDHVFLGSKAHARDREQLRRLRITHILNVTPTKKLDPVAGVPNFFEKDKSFEYRRCPLFDNKAEDISGALEGCVAFIDRAKFYGRVFVHCSKGVSRSVSMVIAYLIKFHEMTYEDALALVQSKRSIAQPNPSFERQLRAYSDRMERLRKRKVKASGESAAQTVAGPSARPAASAASIGPQLPSKSTNPRDEPNSESDVQDSKSIGGAESELGDSNMSIGPALPPGFNKRKLDNPETLSEPGTSRKKHANAAIGSTHATETDSSDN